MTLEELIREEYQIYLSRYQSYIDSDKSDEFMETLSIESERILKQLFKLKHGKDPYDDISEWLEFWKYMANL